VEHHRNNLENKVWMDTQMKFYEIMAIGSGICEYEIWVMTCRGESRLHATKMLFLRSVLRITRCDKIMILGINYMWKT
jgi:hypothetical protein